MENEIAIQQKIAEEISLDEEEIESYVDLLNGINALVYLYLKKRRCRKEISEISKDMHKISKKYLKYNYETECYDPPNSRRYSFIEFLENEEPPRYEDSNAIDKLQVMKDFLAMAKSGKFKNRTMVYKKLAAKYDRSQPLIVSYCKNLEYD